MCLNPKAFFAQKEKILHKPIIYHIPKNMKKNDRRRRAAPKSDTSAKSREHTKKSYELKTSFLLIKFLVFHSSLIC